MSAGKSAEQSRQMLSRALPVGIGSPVVPSMIVWIWSAPLSTTRSDLRITSRSTKEPFPAAPREALWVWAIPSASVNSWFMSTVNVPSPLSKAPSPSGVPAIWYVPTLSPVVMIAVMSTLGAVGTR